MNSDHENYIASDFSALLEDLTKASHSSIFNDIKKAALAPKSINNAIGSHLKSINSISQIVNRGVLAEFRATNQLSKLLSQNSIKSINIGSAYANSIAKLNSNFSPVLKLDSINSLSKFSKIRASSLAIRETQKSIISNNIKSKSQISTLISKSLIDKSVIGKVSGLISITENQEFVDEFAEMLREMHRQQEADAKDDPTEFVDAIQIERLLDQLLYYISNYVDTTISWKTVRPHIIFVVFTILYPLYLSDLTSEEIAASERTIIEKIDKINDRIGELESEFEDELHIYYVVKDRVVPLNSFEKDQDKKKITGDYVIHLVPGQQVELIERSGKWIKVRAFDIHENRIDVGWVFKKYLKRLD